MEAEGATTDAARAHLHSLPHSCEPVEQLADVAAAQPSHEPREQPGHFAQQQPEQLPEGLPELLEDAEPHSSSRDANNELNSESLLVGQSTEECSICFGPLSADITRGFPNSSCPHEFCVECLAKLVRNKSTARVPSQATAELAPPVLCPQCRRPASTELVALLAWLPVTRSPAPVASPVDAVPSSPRPSISKCCLALIAFTITPALWWSIGIIVNELQKD